MAMHCFIAVLEFGLNSVDGGNPMELDGDIYLCGRTQRDSSRGFEGKLAELSLFDASLTAPQVEALYYTVSQQLGGYCTIGQLCHMAFHTIYFQLAAKVASIFRILQ